MGYQLVSVSKPILAGDQCKVHKSFSFLVLMDLVVLL